jgi:ferric-dicitrate binding protein FerR (iron transport regulator)
MGKPVSSGKKKNVLAGHWMQLYAIAATLLLFIACAYISIIRKGSTVQPHLVNAGYSHSGKSIYQLSDGAFFLSEEGSKVRIMRGENNFPEHVILSQGNICFDISGIEPDTITVATPHAAVVLSKRTVTRLVVTELETEVTVLEGNAEVIHRYHRDKQQKLAAGGTVYADFNAVQVAQNLAPEVCQSRTSIFKTYISWVQKQARS